jgi:DNA repair protein RadC
MDITNRMYHAGLFLEVPMIDHLIISETQCLSFEEMGFLAKIAKSKKYVMQFKREEERIKREGEKIGIKKGEKKGVLKKAIQMVKAMKKKGYDVEEIAAISKLPVAKIKKL